MARFCTKCGRPLKEGEVCNCTAQNAGGAQNAGAQQSQPGGQQNYQQSQPGGQQNYQQGQPGGQQNYQQGRPGGQQYYQQGRPGGQQNYQQGQPGGQQNYQQGQPGGQQYYQQGQPGGQQNYQQGQPGGMTKEAEWLNRQKDVIMSGTKNMFSELVPIIKTPVSRVKQISAANSAAVGIEFIVAKAVVAFIFTLIVLLVTQGRLGDLSGGEFDVPFLEPLLAVILLTAGIDFLEAVILKAITGAFNGNTSVNAMINVIGARGVFDTAIIVIVMILMLISLKVAIFAAIFLSPISVFIQYAAYKECVGLDENKKPYAYFVAKLCITIISALIIYFLFKDICDMVLGFVDIFGAILSGDEGNIQDAFTNIGELFTDIFEI